MVNDGRLNVNHSRPLETCFLERITDRAARTKNDTKYSLRPVKLPGHDLSNGTSNNYIINRKKN
jgi:hypothetical protein